MLVFLFFEKLAVFGVFFLLVMRLMSILWNYEAFYPYTNGNF